MVRLFASSRPPGRLSFRRISGSGLSWTLRGSLSAPLQHDQPLEVVDDVGHADLQRRARDADGAHQ